MKAKGLRNFINFGLGINKIGEGSDPPQERTTKIASENFGLHSTFLVLYQAFVLHDTLLPTCLSKCILVPPTQNLIISYPQ